MNARILTTAVMATAFCGVLPARAADSTLLNLMMPDAKVLAGVNVDQARTTPFGQWVLGQIQIQDIQKLKTATGFDPTQDVHEVLVGTAGDAQQHSGLVAARGSFDTAKISAMALANGAVTETYNGVTIIEDPKKQGGVAFLSATYAVAGDLANVKAAIDRQSRPSTLPASAMVAVNTWSLSQDAWVVTTVPPGTLAPKAGMPPIPGVGTSANGQNNAFQGIKSAAAGVKFGANIVVTAQADAATADDAKQMGDAVKLLASLVQMQTGANADPNLLALVKSLQTSTNGTSLTITVSLPQDALVQIVKSGNRAQHPAARRPVQKKQ